MQMKKAPVRAGSGVGDFLPVDIRVYKSCNSLYDLVLVSGCFVLKLVWFVTTMLDNDIPTI